MALAIPRKALKFLVQMLKRKNVRGIILVSGRYVPRLINGFLPKLSEKQRRAFDKVMPRGGQIKFSVQLVGSPTPPIVITFANPLSIEVMNEEQVKQAGIKGIRINVDDIPTLVESVMGSGDIFGALKSLKGQTAAVLSLMPVFMPLVSLGPAEINDLQVRAKKHFKPLLDMLP